jgi:hypothetical protein
MGACLFHKAPPGPIKSSVCTWQCPITFGILRSLVKSYEFTPPPIPHLPIPRVGISLCIFVLAQCQIYEREVSIGKKRVLDMILIESVARSSKCLLIVIQLRVFIFGGGPQAWPRPMGSVGAARFQAGSGPRPGPAAPTEAMDLGQAWGPSPNI